MHLATEFGLESLRPPGRDPRKFVGQHSLWLAGVHWTVMNEGNHLKLEHVQPRVRVKGWVFMVGCRIFFQWLCVKQKKMFGAKSQCFLAATWNHSLTMLNLQPVAHLLIACILFSFRFVCSYWSKSHILQFFGLGFLVGIGFSPSCLPCS